MSGAEADLPEWFVTDIESEIHAHMGHDGQSDEANGWVTDLISVLTPHVLRLVASGPGKLADVQAPPVQQPLAEPVSRWREEWNVKIPEGKFIDCACGHTVEQHADPSGLSTCPCGCRIGPETT